jgi:hypothetical protein
MQAPLPRCHNHTSLCDTQVVDALSATALSMPLGERLLDEKMLNTVRAD